MEIGLLLILKSQSLGAIFIPNKNFSSGQDAEDLVMGVVWVNSVMIAKNGFVAK